MTERTTIVTGSKGGVGTSTVALNLAVQLAAESKKRVLLIDLARPFGQISLMLDFEPRFTILDALERIARLDENVLAGLATRHKSGIDILAGPRQAAMKPEQRQSVTLEAILRLIEIADRAYELVVVDLGVVNPADWAQVLQHAQALLLVSEPTALALGMIDRQISSAVRAGVDSDRIHVVINRWRQNDDDALAAFEKEHKRSVLARLPNDYRQLTEAVQLGIPLMASAANSLVARYQNLAAWLGARISAPLGDEPIVKQVEGA
ncbi:MAG TPA: AAA family ATPase [Candidatus Acidoferrales bacterium]|jgi:pilus assembly protein CpaE|nr:AAA family ATPase [Candidatus Acidoferrales bacterium]